jgi:hypothetical protein
MSDAHLVNAWRHVRERVLTVRLIHGTKPIGLHLVLGYLVDEIQDRGLGSEYTD